MHHYSKGDEKVIKSLSKCINLSKTELLSYSSTVCYYFLPLGVRILKVGACPTCGWGSLSHYEEAAF